MPKTINNKVIFPNAELGNLKNYHQLHYENDTISAQSYLPCLQMNFNFQSSIYHDKCHMNFPNSYSTIVSSSQIILTLSAGRVLGKHLNPFHLLWVRARARSPRNEKSHSIRSQSLSARHSCFLFPLRSFLVCRARSQKSTPKRHNGCASSSHACRNSTRSFV